MSSTKDNSNNVSTIFVSVKQLVRETGLPYRQVLRAIRKGTLPAVKLGNSYYMYEEDASKFIYNLVCKARKVDPDKYKELRNNLFNLGGNNDKS